MDVTYLGHSSFKLKASGLTYIIDPFDPKMVGLKFPPQEAELVIISHHHPDHDNLSLIKGDRKVIDGPGEYEVGGVSVRGFSTYHDAEKGEKRGKNVIYLIEAEGIKLLHLGDLGHSLSEKLIEEIGDINVLMVPVGGEFTLGPEAALDVSKNFGAQITIPMHYRVDEMNMDQFAKLSGVDDFLKLVEVPVERLPKLSIKVSDLTEDQKVVVLEKK